MQDVMVTARMSPDKKTSGNRILSQLGTNASQVINELFDYVIENRSLPFPQFSSDAHTFDEQQLAEARTWLNEFRHPGPSDRFAAMTDDKIRQERLIARGLATEEDFR